MTAQGWDEDYNAEFGPEGCMGAELRDNFHRAIAGAALTMPEEAVMAFAGDMANLRTSREAEDYVRSSGMGLYAQPVQTVLWAWSAMQSFHDMNGLSVYFALRSSLAALQAQRRRRQDVELVWSGPVDQAMPAGSTGAAAVEVIAGASERLLLVSFATGRVPAVIEALRTAAGRGVDIDVLAETYKAATGSYNDDAAKSLPGVVFRRFVWRRETRPVEKGKTALMHAKIILADGQVALITSANLTGRGLDTNMDAGVLIRGGLVPTQLSDLFAHLIENGTIVQV